MLRGSADTAPPVRPPCGRELRDDRARRGCGRVRRRRHPLRRRARQPLVLQRRPRAHRDRRRGGRPDADARELQPLRHLHQRAGRRRRRGDRGAVPDPRRPGVPHQLGVRGRRHRGEAGPRHVPALGPARPAARRVAHARLPRHQRRRHRSAGPAAQPRRMGPPARGRRVSPPRRPRRGPHPVRRAGPRDRGRRGRARHRRRRRPPRHDRLPRRPAGAVRRARCAARVRRGHHRFRAPRRLVRRRPPRRHPRPHHVRQGGHVGLPAARRCDRRAAGARGARGRPHLRASARVHLQRPPRRLRGRRRQPGAAGRREAARACARHRRAPRGRAAPAAGRRAHRRRARRGRHLGRRACTSTSTRWRCAT